MNPSKLRTTTVHIYDNFSHLIFYNSHHKSDKLVTLACDEIYLRVFDSHS